MKKTLCLFWIRSTILLIITAACLAYLWFTFLLNFCTRGPESGITYYLMATLHIAIMIICFLYLYEKLRQWRNISDSN